MIGTTFDTQCNYTAADDGSIDRGCFYQDGVDGPIDSFTARGAESGQLILDTFQILENDIVSLRVIVRKDDRVLEVTQLIEVMQGDPPDIRIQ